MEESKPKSLKTIGLVVSIFSGFIIFSNGMGALAFSLMGLGIDKNGQNEKLEFNFLEFFLDNYTYLCFAMVTIGVLYLIGGLNILKYKLWANRLVTYLSLLLIMLIWILLIAMATMTAGQNGMGIFSVVAIIAALFWSALFGLLIWFLNRQKIKEHFV